MAEKPRTEVRRPVMIEYLDNETEAEISEEEQIFRKFREEFSQGESYASITVYRQPTGFGGRASKQKLTYLFECGLDEYAFPQLLAHLRDHYGSGTYRIQGHDSDRKMLFNRAVEVEAPPKPTSDSTAPNMMDVITTMQRGLAEQQQRTEEMLSRMTGPRGPQVDPMDSIVKFTAAIAGILTPLVPIFMARNPAAAPVATDWLSELAKFGKAKDVLQDVFGGGGDSGGGAAESNFYDLAGKAIEHLGPLAAAAAGSMTRGQRQLPAPSGAAAPAPGATASPAERPIPEINGAQNVRPQRDPLKGQVDILVSNAKAGVSPENMANTVLNMTPDEKLLELKAFISHQNSLERMAAANPEVRNHTGWFQKVREELIRLISEIEADSIPPTDATGTAVANATEAASPDEPH